MAAVKKTETPKISITTSRPVSMMTAIEGDKKKVIIVGAVVILLVALIIWKRK